MTLYKSQISIIVTLLLSNAVIFWGNQDWLWLRLPVIIVLVFVLPGWVWALVVNWLGTRHAIERGLIIFGLSTVLVALGLLVTVLLPGPFTERPVLVTLNGVIILGVVAGLIRSKYRPATETKHPLIWPTNKVLLILALIVVVAAVIRFTRLSYAEFHEDELENMRYIIQAYKGEEFAPFIDSKGPIHWLLPAALWYANGWINEAIARIPFALASLMLVPMMFVLGRRMSHDNNTIGLIAAGIVALNGFFIALARHVENRSLIVFWGALAVWLSYRYYKTPRHDLLIFLALVLAVGLIAHPTVLLYLLIIGFMMATRLRQDKISRQQMLWLAVSAAVFLGVIAIFFIPYFFNPEFERTIEYFANERVGTAWLYNRVANMMVDDSLYSSRFYGPILIALLVWLLARNFARTGRWAVVILVGLSLAIISTILQPEMWIFRSVNLAFVPYLLLTLILLALPKTNIETKFAFVYFAAPFGALLFMAQDAANHIQIAYPGWTLLCAFALSDLWATLSRNSHDLALWRWLKPTTRLTLNALLLGAVPLILFYEYLSFDTQITTYWQAKIDYETNPTSIYATTYGDIHRPRKAISNPRLGGWKTVGYLWEKGILMGDFRTINESFAVPIWYTFETPRSCYNDPQNYWLRRDWKGWPEEETELLARGYTLTRVVQVDQQPMLHLYEKGVPPQEPEVLDVDAYRYKFDRLATPARYAAGDIIQYPTSFNFDNKIQLIGYNLPATSKIGVSIPVTLYWQGLVTMDVRYRAFVYLVNEDNELQVQHDDDPACRLLTTEMWPGQQSSRQFRLPVTPDISPGVYSVIMGMYHPYTLERLNIWDNTVQQSLGDSVKLGEVTISQRGPGK